MAVEPEAPAIGREENQILRDVGQAEAVKVRLLRVRDQMVGAVGHQWKLHVAKRRK
jgi:hypothetical protein